MTGTGRILCVDDEPVLREVIVRALTKFGFDAVAVESVAQALQYLASERVDLVISDWAMPHLSGMDLLQLLRDDGDETPVVVLTAYGSIEHAVEAMRAGAVNFLAKPFESAHLKLAVDQALEVARLRRENARLVREASERRSATEAVGESAAMRKLLANVSAAAASRATVLLQGESGTGKELLARAIHEQSDRRGRAFVRINCAALPEGLIESTLFGHERGAFTGALKRSIGAFERAHGGTLLLDEISEMRLDLQPKLLRVLQEREFERVGGSHSISIDVRIIATTNRNLAAEAAAGRFRSDLYYRLSVFPIHVPTLRERRDDIPLLAYRFASRFAAESGKPFHGFDPETLELLGGHDWPGNVRELQHAIERALILATGPVLTPSLFGELRAGSASTSASVASSPLAPASGAVTLSTLDLAAAERQLIERAIAEAGGNRTRAAELLGIDVRTLRRKLNRGGEGPEEEPDA